MTRLPPILLTPRQVIPASYEGRTYFLFVNRLEWFPPQGLEAPSALDAVGYHEIDWWYTGEFEQGENRPRDEEIERQILDTYLPERYT